MNVFDGIYKMENIEDPLFVQEEIPIRSELVRKLKLETITGQLFEIKNGAQSSSGIKSHWLALDRSGNRVHQQKYSRDGSVICDWIYDPKGRLLQEIAYDASGKINHRFDLAYDHADKWKEGRMYLTAGELHYRVVADRDADGRIIAATYYDSSDQSIRTDAYIYDDRGRLVELDMGHMGEWIYEYDENDNLERKTGHLPGANVFGEVFELEYNDQGLLIQMNHLNHGVTVFEYTFFD
jgi:YD repeat-containing protein